MKRLFLFTSFLVLLFIIVIDGASQKGQYLFDKLTIENGLSNNSITCIFKDSREFIWIGTTDGLNRYDGYNFVIYKHAPSDSNSISDNFISSIVEDFAGNLWIGTQGGGLNIYNPYKERFTAYYYDPEDIQSIPSNFIFHHNSLLLDKDSILWIGTDNGLCSYDLNKGLFKRHALKTGAKDQNEFKDIRIIFQDNEDNLWIGTNSGLIKYLKNTGIIKIYTSDKNNSKSISNNIITSISEDIDRNELWVGTEDGLNVFDKRKEVFYRYFSKKGNEKTISDNSITSIVKDETGNFWIGTKSGGLNKFDASKKEFSYWKNDPSNADGISDNYIDYLFFDKAGLLWIGTVNTGINVLDIKEKQFRLIRNDPKNPNSLSNNTIRSIYEDKEGNIWIGTYGGGLNKYDKNNFVHYLHQLDNTNSLSHNIVTVVHEDINGNLLIGTWGGGLNKIDKKTGIITRNFLNVPEFVNDIYEDENHRIWIGCNGGLYVYDQPRRRLARFDNEQDDKRKLTATSINKILKDHFGNLWIGTFDGLNKIVLAPDNMEVDTIIHYLKNPLDLNSLSDNRIVTLYEDIKGNLWIGTYGGGLNELIQDSSGYANNIGKFVFYSDEDGLSGNTIYGILGDDNGYLWISTNQGLSKFNPVEKTFYNFDVGDGLQGNQFYWRACMRSRTGEMYFGGINGLNIFHPDDIKISRGFPKVILTDLQLFNKSVPVGARAEGRQILFNSITFTDKIKLTRKDYAFTFEFAALTYKSQNKIKYAYKLENFDDKWVYTDARKRYATYSHLRPGDYTFKVKSTNKDGIWNDKFTMIGITVLPAYWETVWAYIVYGIILLLLLYYFRSQVLSRARYRHDIQLERVEREKAEEYNDMKLRFFTNISHEFKTPLTLILGPLSKLVSMDKLDNKIKSQLSLMQSGSKRLLRLISQLMEFRKVETGNLNLRISKNDIIPVLKDIAFSFKSRAIQNKIKYSLKIPVKSAFIWFDRNILETIVYNLLSNAFKFTPENGKIHLSLKFINNKGESIVPNQKDERYLQLKVSDTGIGIPKERMDTLFKRFYQIGKSELQKRGTGIGLALCKDLVDLHHGEISVESEQGTGTDFMVRMPVHESLFNKNEFVEDEDTSKDIQKIPGFIKEEAEVILIDEDLSSFEFKAPENPDAPVILIIEDDIELVKYIGKLLEDKYSILTSYSCENGMEMIVNNEPDLIILDIMMPGMNGLELCRKLKNDLRISHIPVILLTALASVEDQIKGLSTGADAYISKPFHSGHLIVNIEKLIEQRKQLRAHFQREFYIKPDSSELQSMDEKFLNKVINYIKKNFSSSDLNVETLSNEVGISATHLYRKIKSLTDLSPNELIRKLRLKKAAELLSAKQGTISEIMYEVGFSNHSYFAKCFHEEFELSPREFVSKLNNK